MTVGEALAEARYRAGLSVDEVSERTKIREAVIRCIEADDYDACGGDVYVRGYVRAIAGAVGVDAQPLIHEYDTGRAGSVAADPAHTIVDPDFPLSDPAFTIADPGFTIADPGFSADPALTLDDPYRPADLLGFTLDNPSPVYSITPGDGYLFNDPALYASDPAFTAGGHAPAALEPRGTPPGKPRGPAAKPYSRPPAPPVRRRRPRSRGWAIGVLLLLCVAAAGVGVAGSHIVASLRQSPVAATSSSSPQQTRVTPSTQPSTAPGATQSTAAPPSASPTTPNPVKTVRDSYLPVSYAEAFGPNGAGDGDNPQGAMFPVTPGATSPWETDWYTTPDFGKLKPGTGLLLDMGRTVTMTSVLLDLSQYQGADLQLQAGAGTDVGSLPVVASASDAGGTVRLRFTAPVHSRYLLLWFTLLPPNGQGTYQESVFRVIVNGHP